MAAVGCGLAVRRGRRLNRAPGIASERGVHCACAKSVRSTSTPWWSTVRVRQSVRITSALSRSTLHQCQVSSVCSGTCGCLLRGQVVVEPYNTVVCVLTEFAPSSAVQLVVDVGHLPWRAERIWIDAGGPLKWSRSACQLAQPCVVVRRVVILLLRTFVRAEALVLNFSAEKLIGKCGRFRCRLAWRAKADVGRVHVAAPGLFLKWGRSGASLLSP